MRHASRPLTTHRLNALDRPQVLGALEGSRIRTAQLAHRARHLADGGVFVLLHPLPHSLLNGSQVTRAVTQQTRAEHGDVGTGQEQLARVLSKHPL